MPIIKPYKIIYKRHEPKPPHFVQNCRPPMQLWQTWPRLVKLYRRQHMHPPQLHNLLQQRHSMSLLHQRFLSMDTNNITTAAEDTTVVDVDVDEDGDDVTIMDTVHSTMPRLRPLLCNMVAMPLLRQ